MVVRGEEAMSNAAVTQIEPPRLSHAPRLVFGPGLDQTTLKELPIVTFGHMVSIYPFFVKYDPKVKHREDASSEFRGNPTSSCASVPNICGVPARRWQAWNR